jgi:hypothetical protein
LTSTYRVRTEKYGDLTVQRESIAEARRWAREALGIKDKRATSVDRDVRKCGGCDSAPCCCGVAS